MIKRTQQVRLNTVRLKHKKRASYVTLALYGPRMLVTSANRPFWGNISILQTTDYQSQPHIHLISSSNRNWSEIRQKSFYAIFFPNIISNLVLNFYRVFQRIDLKSEMNTRLIRASKMNSKKVYCKDIYSVSRKLDQF